MSLLHESWHHLSKVIKKYRPLHEPPPWVMTVSFMGHELARFTSTSYLLCFIIPSLIRSILILWRVRVLILTLTMVLQPLGSNQEVYNVFMAYLGQNKYFFVKLFLLALINDLAFFNGNQLIFDYTVPWPPWPMIFELSKLFVACSTCCLEKIVKLNPRFDLISSNKIQPPCCWKYFSLTLESFLLWNAI